jgi:hypothetical protein
MNLQALEVSNEEIREGADEREAVQAYSLKSF